MDSLLAELSSLPEPGFLFQSLLAASFVGNLVVAWVLIADRNKSQKREVSFAEEFARKEDLLRVEAEVSLVNTDLQKLKDTILQNGELRKNFIIAHIDSKQAETRHEIHRLHARIDDLLKEDRRHV